MNEFNHVRRIILPTMVTALLLSCSTPDKKLIPCSDDFDCPLSMICSGGCIDGAGKRFDLDAGDSRLIYRNDQGRLNIYDSSGNPILRNATATLLLDSTGDDGKYFDIAQINNRSVTTETFEDSLGKATGLVISAAGKNGEPNISWIVSAYRDEGFYTFELEIDNVTDDTLMLAKTTPLVIDGYDGGALFVGGQPVEHRILENGSHSYFDYYAAVLPGDVRDNSLAGSLQSLIPGDFKGYSVSNNNHCIKDLSSDAVWVAGALTFDRSSSVINLSYLPGLSQTSPDDRHSFSYFAAESAYLPRPKPIPPGSSMQSERYYVHPTETNAFEGLERYALTIKKQLGIRLWQERAEGNRVPNGWNSWSTSGGTGGYGTAINEEIILANLDVMADEFRDWGMDWFQIDDGYEPSYGDWWWSEEKFPHGPAWMSEQIRAKGFKPGLWMAALTHHDDSQTLADHPDWFSGWSDVGTFFNGGYSILDITNPEVQEYLHELFYKFRHEWGFEWLKLDFAYFAILGDNYYDPTYTREEAYRTAMRIIREEIGDESFFLAVSALGVHMGLIDANRLTLDNMPVWDKQPEDSDEDRSLQQGFKPTVRTAARRYYLHNRVWINHSDLIVFRSNTRDETWPRVTLNEAQAFCSYVGLSGGIVKLGDRLVDMEAEHINSVRKLLPIYGKGARPLDIFEREFPELWHLDVDSSLDGYDEKYHVLGLFNWGRNWDQSVNPYVEMPDDGSDRSFEIDLAERGMAPGTYLAYEFWSQTFLGEVAGTFSHSVATHTADVVALRPLLDRPQLLGWNRQITMGATDIESLAWDEQAMTLTLDTKVAKPSVKAPFTYNIAFHVPDGYTFSTAAYSGSPVADTTETVDGKVLTINFVPQQTGEITLTLAFDTQ
jgi:Melibiase